MPRTPSLRRPLRLAAGLLLLLLAAGALWRGLDAPRPGTPRGTRTALAGLTHLGHGLERRADYMQTLFPEGRVFTLALYGMAWVDVGLDTERPALRARALHEARRALALATAPASQATFEPAGGLPRGMFYHAWTGRLHAGTLHLGGGAARDSVFRQTCDQLDGAIRTRGPFVASYGTTAWPADTAVGASVLQSCGTLLDGRYAATAAAWLRAALAHADPATGLLSHHAERPEPRGSSLTLLIPFVYEISPAVATAQFDGLQARFATRFVGLPALREYQQGVSGAGDVDSGPLVGGVSAATSVVGVAAAWVVGRPAVAADLRATPEVLGFPVEWRGRRIYGFGRLPVGEAFLAWATTVRPWNASVAAASSASPFSGWRTGWALVWTPVALLGLALVVSGARRRSSSGAYRRRRGGVG